MTYKINGFEIEQPSSGRWLPHEQIGIDGYGRPIYSSVTQFEINWDILSPTSMNQILNFYYMSTTGTIVFDLPKYMNNTYTFYSYTGCSIYMPQFRQYFTEYYYNVSLIIGNIRT